MVTEALRVTALALALSLALASAPSVAARADTPPVSDALVPAPAEAARLLDAGQYRAAIDVLERAVRDEPTSAEAFLLLGKAYGRLAEREPWYRAVTFARRCGEALERAVALAPDDPAALAALARFYEQAPPIVGGGAEKAAPLRERLRRLADS